MEEHNLLTDYIDAMIRRYIPTPRDKALGSGEYYVRSDNGSILVVKIRDKRTVCLHGFQMELCYLRQILPDSDGEEIDYGFRMADLYDNITDCINRQHAYYDDWENLRRIQEEIREGRT